MRRRRRPWLPRQTRRVPAGGTCERLGSGSSRPGRRTWRRNRPRRWSRAERGKAPEPQTGRRTNPPPDPPSGTRRGPRDRRSRAPGPDRARARRATPRTAPARRRSGEEATGPPGARARGARGRSGHRAGGLPSPRSSETADTCTTAGPIHPRAGAGRRDGESFPRRHRRCRAWPRRAEPPVRRRR